MADFEKLFEENREFIFRYLLKLCKNTSLAEELTQETFFRAYINLRSLRNEEKSSVWICSIAKNTYFAWYNESKKLYPLDERLLDVQNFNNLFDIEELFSDKEIYEKALSCLHRLEEPYKEVFMLSVFGGIPLKDISKIFGKSESWARVTFYRAKQKLSVMMEEHE